MKTQSPKPKAQNRNVELKLFRLCRNFRNFKFSILHFKLSPKGGFTLVETIVALFLIVSALAGPFTLATRGVFSAKFSKNKLVALNLAQEGMEIIREMRDTNILGGSDWRGSGSCASPCTILANGDYNVDAVHDQPGSILSGNITPLRLNSSGFYDRQSGGVTEPSFTRVIRICSGGCAADEMGVVSEVTWTESGVARRVELDDKFYNWR